MKGSGRKTNSMEKDSKHGLMVQAIKVITLRAESMVEVVSLGPMAVHTQASLLKTILRDREFISGPTVVSMKASGRTIKWKAMAFSHGPMAGDMRANI